MIDTIFFDVGNTLRVVVKDAAFSRAAEDELMRLVGATEPHDVFFEKLEKRWKAYRKLAKTTLIDASEMELWSQHLLPDYPVDTGLRARRAAHPPLARPRRQARRAAGREGHADRAGTGAATRWASSPTPSPRRRSRTG